MKTVYVYVCAAHKKLGKFSRFMDSVEIKFAELPTAEMLHLKFCQVKGCQFPREMVIELTFNRVNDDLELVSSEAKLS